MFVRINDALRGQHLADAFSDGQIIRIRTVEGREVESAWASAGPELRAWRENVVSRETILNPALQYVRGKQIRHVLTDGERLLIVFTDGHELAVRFLKREPEATGVNVRITLPGVDMFGGAFGG